MDTDAGEVVRIVGSGEETSDRRVQKMQAQTRLLMTARFGTQATGPLADIGGAAGLLTTRADDGRNEAVGNAEINYGRETGLG